ncbi:MAG TPA: thiamine-phosphate kinase [Acidobacteriaceae bacterium]|jgi:thiamine-monophosphate kinase|nr:thiamine-phosphate kinase [Acidobacteriaceae bacterium]
MAAPPKFRALPGELALIESIRRKAATVRPGSRALRLGIGDDCALLRPKSGHEICVTTDFSLEGVHFRRDGHPPQSVGHRCLARGLSDLAAMGAEPVAVFLSLALPARTPQSWLDGFLDGFLALAACHRVPLAGGDTAQSPTGIAADIVAIGQVPAGTARLRSAARPGDTLYVTGSLGGSAAELLLLERAPKKYRRLTRAAPDHPHLYPQPRLAVGRRLRTLAHPMIDLSDGLSTDLAHLCAASGLAAVLDEAALPIHPLAVQAVHAGLAASALELALHGGEDYELLFTAAPSVRIPRKLSGVPIRPIGTMRKSGRNQPNITLATRNGRQMLIPPRGWEHFSQKNRTK